MRARIHNSNRDFMLQCQKAEVKHNPISNGVLFDQKYDPVAGGEFLTGITATYQ